MPDEIAVAMIGTGDGGPQPKQMLAVTSGENTPNLLVKVIPRFIAILVRFGHLFFVTLSGLIGAKGIDAAVLDLGSFALSIQGMLVASLVVAGVGLIKDLVTIFGQLEGKYPLATGSI